MEIINKKDFVEIKFSGYSNGNVFDSNIDEDLKKISKDAKPKETIVIVGESMVVSGFDRALEGKEIGKDYEIKVPAKDGFGERRKELVKTIPLKIFREKKINPYPGMILAMDENLVRIITVSGARVMADFNNPLAGKELVYKFKIVRKIQDGKEKAKTVFESMLRFVPDFELKGNEIVMKGPKFMEKIVDALKEKFKELVGKELKFEIEEEKAEQKEDKTEEKKA
ncbi:FKBP-type peptidyl-prolyl cis-trans isomerase [Candidatus Pacearchaeota archaeon]|nr:FKBP-type peptidyl-prolyl cis-trans isomerase [Candidatus Pacearchaeota archaeon]